MFVYEHVVDGCGADRGAGSCRRDCLAPTPLACVPQNSISDYGAAARVGGGTVDDLGTAALVRGGGGSGSSIVLTMTAVQPPPVDAGVVAVTRVLRGGRKLGFTVVDLVDSCTGRLYFTGNLLKYSR